VEMHARPMEYLAKRRRTYLWTKAAANTLAAIGTIVFFLFAALFVVFVALGLWTQLPSYFMLAVIGGISGVGGIVWRVSLNLARAVPHVPPVREQIASLPANEILVRSSAEPAALPEELLRAAQSGAGVEALLRPSEGKPT